MYGFIGRCGEYVDGLEIHPGQIHFACPKFCTGVTVSENSLSGTQEFLCADCKEATS